MVTQEIDTEEIYNKDNKLKKEEVEKLMQWEGSQPHLPELTELQIIHFLHSCYYKQEAAKIAIDTFLSCRTTWLDLFQLRTFKDDSVRNFADASCSTVLPKLMPNGDMVYFLKMCSNPEDFNVTSAVKLFDALVMIHLHQNGPANGFHLVVDIQDIVLGHVFKLSLGILAVKKFFYLLQEAFPIRMKGLHFINIVPFMDKIMNLLKPCFKKELLDQLHLHSGSATVYEYIPQDLLPKEYGGQSGPMKVLQENVKVLIANNEEWLNLQDTLLVDESKREGNPKNLPDVFGVEGSFRKLEVD